MKKNIKYLALGLIIFGVFLAWFAMMFANSSPKAESPPAEKITQSLKKDGIKAVVFAKALEAGHQLQADDLEIQEVEPSTTADTTVTRYTQPAALIGRMLAHQVLQGAPVQAADLLTGIAAMLRPGERAVAIKVEEATAVGHKIQPGDWVDVLVVFRKDGQEVPDTQARRLLERRKVLAYGELTDVPLPIVTHSAKDGASAKAEPAAEALRNTHTARTAVIAVRTDEVNALVLAERQGQVMLALRSPIEKEDPLPEQSGMVQAVLSLPDTTQTTVANNQVLTLASLAEHANSSKPQKPVEAAKPSPVVIPVAAKVAPRQVPPKALGTPVEFIRGTRVETVHY